MPEMPTRLQQPSPVKAQVDLPTSFPPVPQSIINRFPEAAEWNQKLRDFWTKSNQAIQQAQVQVANYNNSRVVFSVDQFLIYAKNGIPQPMFSVDSTGVKIGDVLVVNTPARKMYIGEGVLGDDNTPFYVDALGNFSLGASLVWDPETDTLTITGTIVATSGSIGGFNIGIDYIRDAANTMGLASTVTGGDDVRFWAGDTFANRATAPFYVKESGALRAISGVVGGFTLSATTLSATGILLDSSVPKIEFSGSSQVTTLNLSTLSMTAPGSIAMTMTYDHVAFGSSGGQQAYFGVDHLNFRAATAQPTITFGIGSATNVFRISTSSGVETLEFGADTNIYRSAANVLKTDSEFHAALGVTSLAASVTNVLTGSGGVGIIGTTSNHAIQLFTNNTPKVAISAAGLVTIGSLAGVGTRTVVADASGNLSAP